MTDLQKNPLARPLSVILVGLSLSIGWGIRGNFGHETGAMIPGALAAIAVCLLSRREDWRRRVAYCALFGGLGWGFGGSISYMHTVSYTASGQVATIAYGFFTMFLVGGLWAGMGGAGTVLPLAMDRERLTRLFTPLCFVLGMLLLHKLIEGPIEELLKTSAAEGMDDRWHRHKSPLYWMDTDWFPAMMALVGVCLFDLWNRRFSNVHWLGVFLAVGALLGWGAQALLDSTGGTKIVAKLLVVPLGDLTAINKATGQPFDPENLLTNWPQFFGDFPQHLGWGLGLLTGGGAYFALFGKWRDGSSLFLYMALGWLIAFLVMPVLGTIALRDFGGFRLTPPRSDDWAGVTGVFIGTTIYALRNRLGPVAIAGTTSFILGGLSFATAQLIRAMLIVPGHPYRTPDGTTPTWAHYQSANWHSFLEQSHGFGFGIAIAIVMALLWNRMKPANDEPTVRRWTVVFATGFVLVGMTYMNLFKCVGTWVEEGVMPAMMKAPLIEPIQFSALGWFNLAWLCAGAAAIALMVSHLRNRLEIVPSTWLGKGMLIYVSLLWIMVVGNFLRAIPNFHENRLITEWAIAINACAATYLAIKLSRPPVTVAIAEPENAARELAQYWGKGALAALVMVVCYTGIIWGVYGNATVFYPDYSHKRFGEEALWREKPILKNEDHR